MPRHGAWRNSLLGHDDMRRELLIDGPLAHGSAMLRAATPMGVGHGLVRWQQALGHRVAKAWEARQPTAERVPGSAPRAVLALMAPVARWRWRDP